MSFWNNIKTMDKRFSWSFLGTLIGIIGIGYGIYADFFKEEKPELIFDLMSNTQVLDLKEDVSELQIHYKHQDLKKSKKSLVLITVRVSNKGNAPITENDYYSKTPFGFKITRGNIAEPPSLINSSRKFFENSVRLSTDSLNNIFIDKVPIDYGEYFTVKVLTICNNEELPDIIPFGEISGLRGEIYTVRSYKSERKEELSFWKKLTFGTFGIHVARFFYYLLCMALVSISIAFPVTMISDYFEDKKKKKAISKYKKSVKIKLTQNSETIFNLYKQFGETQISWLLKTLNDQKILEEYLIYMENKKKENSFINDFSTFSRVYQEDIEIRQIQHLGFIYTILNTLLDEKIIDKENKNTVKPDFLKELEEFNYYLNLK